MLAGQVQHMAFILNQQHCSECGTEASNCSSSAVLWCPTIGFGRSTFLAEVRYCSVVHGIAVLFCAAVSMLCSCWMSC
jgi:hypothetical protein